MMETLPPPPMFCEACDHHEPDQCCSQQSAAPGVKKKVNKVAPPVPAKKSVFKPNENSFSTLPSVRSHSLSLKKSKKTDSKAGIQV